jgi:protoheme IX farnesyltransferase
MNLKLPLLVSRTLFRSNLNRTCNALSSKLYTDHIDSKVRTEFDSRLKQYAKLSKIRLTGFVTSTAFTGGFLASQSFVDSLPIIATASLGTFLCSSSAAALNQLLETPYDSQMRRTAIRPLVVGQVSPLETVIFALVTGVSGVSLLYSFVNGITAALGAANLVLYSFIYTPMKRSNVANTWIGSIVGAVPPLMGTTAVLGHINVESALLALILFSWQFPHFNALSWNLRHEYARAGYRMMSVVDPDLCKRVALRHSALLLAYSCALPLCGSTPYLFTLLALPLNAQFIRLSWLFHKEADSSSSRKLFRFSLLYLPAILGLLVTTSFY